VSKPKTLDELAENVRPGAKVPRGFQLYGEKMMRLWLSQNQKPEPKPKAGKRGAP